MNGFGDPVLPPTPAGRTPTVPSLYELVAVNANGTLELRSTSGRSSLSQVPGMLGYTPSVGDRVVVAFLDGDRQTPVVLSVLA